MMRCLRQALLAGALVAALSPAVHATYCCLVL
ncbi:MAG: hypothetical protein KatS3mg111_2365 [Pirellulaceae bacterium]|nr:MAG: hypothetical protein KatS3mg111_2365 [Pirellulaceae bacterium]